MSTHQKLDIAKELSFHKKSPKNARSFTFVSSEPVFAFLESEDKQFLRMPFHYAHQKFKTVNNHLPHKRVQIDKKGEFNLTEGQRKNANAVIDHLKTSKCCTLCLEPGGGKTATSCVISTSVKLLTLVLVQNKLLLTQWENEFEKFTTARTYIVDKKVPFDQDATVIICHVRRWALIPEETRNQVGFLVIDESHLLCNQYGASAMLSVTPRYMLACTATPSRSRDGMYDLMDSFFGPNEVKNKKQKQMLVTRISTPYLGEKVESEKTGRLVWSTYIQSLLYNVERNELIVSRVLADAEETGRKILVLTSEKKHVDLLYNMFLEQDLSTDWLSGTKSSYQNCQVLVGNIQKCGTGFDDANFCENFDGERISIIWIVTEIANVETAEQVVGRARVDEPWIRQLVDKDPLSQKHWRLCRGVYVKRGAIIC